MPNPVTMWECDKCLTRYAEKHQAIHCETLPIYDPVSEMEDKTIFSGELTFNLETGFGGGSFDYVTKPIIKDVIVRQHENFHSRAYVVDDNGTARLCIKDMNGEFTSLRDMEMGDSAQYLKELVSGN